VLVKFQATVFFAVLAIILLTGLVGQAHAIQMTALMVPSTDQAQVTFTGEKIITIKYSPGSALANEFNGKEETVEFTVNGTVDNDGGTGMTKVIQTVNDDLLNEKNSLAQISQASLHYKGTIRGNPDSVLLAYTVNFEPTIQKYVLSGNSQQGVVLDVNWRSVVVNQSLVVNADIPGYGKQQVEVNYPIGLLQVTHPDLAKKLENSQAAGIFHDPLLAFDRFGPPAAPMTIWHFLFDATGAQAGAQGLLNEGANASKVVSIFALGESSFREGVYNAVETDSSANIDGTAYSIHSTTPPPSGQLTIAGFAKPDTRQNAEVMVVTADAPPGTTSSGNFPIQVLLVFGGMMGAIAIFILFKARK